MTEKARVALAKAMYTEGASAESTLEHLAALLDWATRGNRSGNPYGKAPVVNALKHLAAQLDEPDWTEALADVHALRWHMESDCHA